MILFLNAGPQVSKTIWEGLRAMVLLTEIHWCGISDFKNHWKYKLTNSLMFITLGCKLSATAIVPHFPDY